MMMKKYILSLIIALCAMSGMAQPGSGSTVEIMKLKTADGKIVRYEVKDIQQMQFGSLFHAFDGYYTASAAYFKDYYFGGTCKLYVWSTAEGYDVTLSDPVWGEAEFENVEMNRGTMTGTGTITVSEQFGGGTYTAEINGAMASPVITIPDLHNGGTTLAWHLGNVPATLKVNGRHQGSVSVYVGEQFGPYVNSSVTYTISVNENGTINIVVPEYTLDNTAMGNLTLGSYTISNVAYDEEKGVFYRDYSDDGLSFHFKSTGGSNFDNDYTFEKLGNITVTPTETGLTIVNNFQPGSMPFPISATFEKAAQTHTR